MQRILYTFFVLFLSLPLAAFDVVVNIQHATCGNSVGSIWAYSSGGAAPYTYTWSNGANTGGISDVAPGIYTVTVFDSNGDQASATVELLMTPDLFPAIVPSAPAWSCDAACTGGYYNFIPLNGVSPYNIVFDPPGPVGNASPNGLNFNGLCPGVEYMITVNDANGCTGTVGPLAVIGPMAPVLENSVVTGSCPGGETGSMFLEFDAVDSLVVSGPNGGLLMQNTSNPFQAGNLAAGMYTVYAYVGMSTSPPGTTGPSCSATFSIEIPISAGPCGTIDGIVFADLDGNCTQESADLGIPNKVLAIEPGGHLTITNAQGQYSTGLFYNDYTLDLTLPGYAVLCPVLPAPFTLSGASPTATIDLAMDPLFGPDVRSHLYAGVHRPGFAVIYSASLHNEGPYGFTDLVFDLYFDPLLVLVNAPGPSTLIAPGHLQWTIPALGGYSILTYAVEFTIPAIAALIGTVVTGTATVTSTPADSDASNDSYSVTNTIVGSYDPNDKLATTSSRSSEVDYYLDEDNWVDYTIRFQNTGTAEAINVYLLDTIRAELDPRSLEILSASHSFLADFLPGHVLRFDFPGIMLPDSTADLLGSQGYVSFRMRPIDGLLPGAIIANAADIYFDFNEPIRTNTSELMVALSTGIAARALSDSRVFPNPATDRISCTLPAGNWRAEVLGMDGRVLLSRNMTGPLLNVDVASLASGCYVLRVSNGADPGMRMVFQKH